MITITPETNIAELTIPETSKLTPDQVRSLTDDELRQLADVISNYDY